MPSPKIHVNSVVEIPPVASYVTVSLFTQTEKYMVSLIAENNTCKDTLEIKEIFVAYPEARFSTTQICGAQTVNFKNDSKGHDRTFWDFGDGTTSNTMDKNFSHVYPSSFTSTSILLIVYNDSTGCVDSMRKNINFSVFDSICFASSIFSSTSLDS